MLARFSLQTTPRCLWPASKWKIPADLIYGLKRGCRIFVPVPGVGGFCITFVNNTPTLILAIFLPAWKDWQSEFASDIYCYLPIGSSIHLNLH